MRSKVLCSTSPMSHGVDVTPEVREKSSKELTISLALNVCSVILPSKAASALSCANFSASICE